MLKFYLGKGVNNMSPDKNPQKIKSMFDEISLYYDKMNNLISFGTHNIIKFLAIKNLEITSNSNILDICCGTGDFTRLIQKFYPRSKVIGLDFSPEMLKLAKKKNPKGVYVQGDCTNLPFGDREFDFVTMGFGLRNIENRSKALEEVYRVLKKNGKFLHLDFGYHNRISKIFDFFVPVMVKILGKNPDHYKYLLSSKNEFPEPYDLVKEFGRHGFECIKVKNYLFDTISAQVLLKTSVTQSV